MRNVFFMCTVFFVILYKDNLFYKFHYNLNVKNNI